MNLKFRFTRHGYVAAKAGTANRGAQIRWGRLSAGLLLASVAALMTIACGGSSSSNLQQTATGNGALYTFISDTPSCDLLSLGIFITEMNLHKAGKPSTSLVTVWPTNSSLTSPVIEMSTLRDTMTVANLTSVAPGTYDQITLKVVVNSASIFDSTQSPPVSSFSPTVSTDTVTLNLQPQLTLTAGKVSAATPETGSVPLVSATMLRQARNSKQPISASGKLDEDPAQLLAGQIRGHPNWVGIVGIVGDSEHATVSTATTALLVGGSGFVPLGGLAA